MRRRGRCSCFLRRGKAACGFASLRSSVSQIFLVFSWSLRFSDIGLRGHISNPVTQRRPSRKDQALAPVATEAWGLSPTFLDPSLLWLFLATSRILCLKTVEAFCVFRTRTWNFTSCILDTLRHPHQESFDSKRRGG